ncbi:MAG: hypothetical protein EOO38_21970 [Cytophagaceae bacterium]|nr:MAG: hypothetical protein EOO38_21970 [Cytophagaceae bacterium]
MIWRLDVEAPTGRPLGSNVEPFTPSCFSPDGQFVIMTSNGPYQAEIWEVGGRTDSPVERTLSGHRDFLISGAFFKMAGIF